MHDGDTPRQPSRSHYYDQPTRWGRFVADIKRKCDERRAKKKQETPTDKAARRTANATVWMAIFTFVLIGVSIAQWRILSRQLDEMHSSGADTHNLAAATGNLVTVYKAQASDMQKLRSAAEKQTTNTSNLVEATQTAANAALGQEGITRASNAINKQAFTSTQRAFIVVDSMRAERVPGNDGKGSYAIKYTPVVQNAGNTPATIRQMINVTPRGDVTMLPIGEFVEDYLLQSGLIRAPMDPVEVGKGLPTVLAGYSVKNVSLGPKDSLPPKETYGDSVISGQDVMAMQFKPFNLGKYFFGVIDYTDIYGADHVTKYCFAVDSGEIAIGIGTVPIYTQNRCSHWNCTDDQCRLDRLAYERDVADAKRRMKVENGPKPAVTVSRIVDGHHGKKSGHRRERTHRRLLP